MKLFLKSDIVKNKKLSDKAIGVYVSLIALYKPGKEINYVSAKNLIHNLTGDVNCCGSFYNDIILGLDELITKNMIVETKRIRKSERILDLSSLYFKTEDNFFIQLEDGEIFKIMKCDANVFSLLRYYLFILSSITAEDKLNTVTNLFYRKDVGYMPQHYFVTEYGMNQRTIYTYNRLLQNANVLYVFKPVVYRQTCNHGIISFSGVYGRYVNKDLIQKCGDEYLKSFIDKSSHSPIANVNRSMANKFRFIRDQGKVYEYEEMKEIYLAAVERNKALRDRYYSDDLYNQYKKDLSIFKDYDFYVEEEQIQEEASN